MEVFSQLRRLVLLCSFAAVSAAYGLGEQVGAPQNSPAASDSQVAQDHVLPATKTGGVFTDVTAGSGVQFKHMASHTPRKYLLETMGAGVAWTGVANPVAWG